jgi:predicted NUDIX family phosphoesterase
MSEILVIRREQAGRLPIQGAWPFLEESMPGDWQWMERAKAETDEDFLQLIPYVALLNTEYQVWVYRRSGGDHRPMDRRSCGIGGHVDREDARESLFETLAAALTREVSEELKWDVSGLAVPHPEAWLYEHHHTVGRVHLGLLYVLEWSYEDTPQIREGESLEGLGFAEVSAIIDDERFELWSRLAAHFLSERHQASHT